PDAGPAGADPQLHDPLPRCGHRGAGPDADGDEVPRLRPPVAEALARSRPGAGRPLHPLLRARRAGAPGDGLPRLHRDAPRDLPTGPGCGMTGPVLDVRGLAYAYPDGHQALFGIDLTVAAGERVAILGPNGAGKTTLVLHLNGILEAGAGSVTVNGLPVVK